MRPIYLLLALTTLPACDDGKIDLGEWENGGPDADGASTDSGLDGADPDVNDSGNPTGDDGGASADGGSGDDTSGLDTGETPSTAKDIDGDGFTVDDGDCNDSDSTIFPGAAEQCDDVDHDCDGLFYNNVLVRYDSTIGESWDAEFPTLLHTGDHFTASELWLGYRDFDTDLNAYGEGRLTYTGSIRPVVITYVEESEGFRGDYQARFTHDDAGRIQSERVVMSSVETTAPEPSDTGTDATETSTTTYTHLMEFTFTADGLIEREAFDYGEEIDGILEREVLYTYDESRRVQSIVTHRSSDGDRSTSSVTYLYEEAESGFLKHEQEDTDGDGLVDHLTTYTYGSRDELLFVDIDSLNDGIKDRQQYYIYSFAGLVLEFGDSYLAPTYAPSTRVTSYEYDTDGNLTFTSVDDGFEATPNVWTRNTYEDGQLIKEEFGEHSVLAPDADPLETVLYDIVYGRDDDGRWTSRTTTSYTTDRLSGTENASYNIDGHWTGWKWTVEGSEEADASMTSTCVGPPSADTISDF